MTTMNISLPDEMRAYIDRQVTQGSYSTASEYLRELIREDQRRKTRREIEEKLLARLQSEASEMTEEDWQAIRQEAIGQLKARRKS